MAQLPAYGREVVEWTYEMLQIDDAWIEWTERGFNWWCSDLMQSVWTDPPRWDNGLMIQRVNARTAMLRDVPDTPQIREGIAMLNATTTLSAYSYLEHDQCIITHCSVIAHVENVASVKSLFAAAAAHQVADAGIKAGIGAILGGERDSSSHPTNGPRRVPDAMSMVIEQSFAPAGRGASPFAADIDEVLGMEPAPWLLAQRTAEGMFALLPSWDTNGSMKDAAPNSEPTMLHVSVTDRNPQLGAGTLVRLVVPFPGDHATHLEDMNLLNLAEGSDGSDIFSLGGWCAMPPSTCCHVLFLPALVHRPGLLQTVAFLETMRAKWVAQLFGGNSPGEEARKPLPVDGADRSSAMNTKQALEWCAHHPDKLLVTRGFANPADFAILRHTSLHPWPVVRDSGQPFLIVVHSGDAHRRLRLDDGFDAFEVLRMFGYVGPEPGWEEYDGVDDDEQPL